MKRSSGASRLDSGRGVRKTKIASLMLVERCWLCSPNSGWLCRKRVLLPVVVWKVVARLSDYASLSSSLDEHEQ